MPLHKRNFNLFTLVLDMSDLAFMKNILDMLLVFKEFPIMKDHGRKNLTMLVLMNCAGEDRIKVLTPNPIPMQGQLIMDILKEKESVEKHCSADWVQAVNKAVKLIEQAQMRKDIHTYYLIVISPLKAAPCFTDWGSSARIMKSRDVQFIVCINQNVTYSLGCPIRYYLSLRTANEYVTIPEMNDNIEKAKKMANYSVGAVTGPKYFLDFVTFMEQKTPMQTWIMRLHLGNYIFPTLVSQIFYSRANVIGNGKQKFSCYKQFESTSSLLVDEHDALVDEGKVVQKRNYFGKMVVIPDGRAGFLTPQNMRWSFQIECFVKKMKLSDLHFGDKETYTVTADVRCQRAGHFVEFVDRLLINGLYAIVRFKSPIKLFVLIPQTGAWLLMTPLIRRTRSWRRRNLLHSRKKSNYAYKVTPSLGMMKLRSYLFNKERTLFYPQCALGLDSHIIIDDVRRNFGFNVEGYKQEVPLKVETNSELETLLSEEFCNVSLEDI